MKKQLILLAIAGLAFTACKKDSPTKTTQLLKKVTEINNGDTTITNLSYDNSKRVLLVKTEDSETKLGYTNDKLTTIENKIDADNKTKLEITYDGAKPKSAVYTVFEDNALVQKYRYTYTLNASNQVSEILVKDSTNTTVVAKQVITYANNNVSKVQLYEGTTLVTTQEITYGNKKSPFYAARTSYVVDALLADFYAVNEVIKEKYTVANVEHETTKTYTYDVNGFPLTSEVSEKTLPNGTPEVSKLVFTY